MVNLPLILQAGIDILLSVIDGSADVTSLIPMAVDLIITICDTLLENLPQIIAAAIEIIVAVVQGIG